jgi:hypothetical protein
MRSNFSSVSVVQEEIFGQLSRRWVSMITAVSSGLLGGEEVYGHFQIVSSQKPTGGNRPFQRKQREVPWLPAENEAPNGMESTCRRNGEASRCQGITGPNGTAKPEISLASL